MSSDFWETLERVANLADGPPVVRPRLVALADQPSSTSTKAQHSTTLALASTTQSLQPAVASGTVVRPGSLATPVSQARAIFDALQAITIAAEGIDLSRHETEESRPDPEEERGSGADVPSWDDFAHANQPNLLLTGLVAKHRAFERIGEIDIDLDRPRRRWRWRRSGW